MSTVGPIMVKQAMLLRFLDDVRWRVMSAIEQIQTPRSPVTRKLWFYFSQLSPTVAQGGKSPMRNLYPVPWRPRPERQKGAPGPCSGPG